MEYHVVIGWGYVNEHVVFESGSYRDAKEYYESLHQEWLEAWLDSDIDSEQAREERPYLLRDTYEEVY